MSDQHTTHQTIDNNSNNTTTLTHTLDNMQHDSSINVESIDTVNVIKYAIEKFSDIILKYDNTEFHLHKQVLGGM